MYCVMSVRSSLHQHMNMYCLGIIYILRQHTILDFFLTHPTTNSAYYYSTERQQIWSFS